jgi:hypothetical protein
VQASVSLSEGVTKAKKDAQRVSSRSRTNPTSAIIAMQVEYCFAFHASNCGWDHGVRHYRFRIKADAMPLAIVRQAEAFIKDALCGIGPVAFAA